VLAQCLDLLAGRLFAVEESLADPHRSEANGLGLLHASVYDSHDLHAAAAHVDAKAIAQRQRVSDRQVAIPSLFGAADHPHPQPRALFDCLEEIVAVGGVANRAGGHGVHVLHAGGSQERREDGGCVQSSVHRLFLENACVTHSRAYASGLPDLV